MEPKLLEKIGLTRNESKVYTTLLRTGTAKTGAILKRSGLTSGKIYEILEGLKAKGLVSESVINNVRHFTAAPPDQLLEYIEKKKAELQAEEEDVKAALPELQRMRKALLKEAMAVTYTGFRGIKTAADEALAAMKPGEDILAMGVTELKDERFNRFWRRWSLKRIRRKIPARHIFSERSAYFEGFKKMEHTQARVLTAFTPVAVDVFGSDKVLILNYQEPVSCILIYDKNAATSFRQFFEQLWKVAKA